MFPTQTVRQTDPGSLTSVRLRSRRTVQLKQFICVLVACVLQKRLTVDYVEILWQTSFDFVCLFLYLKGVCKMEKAKYCIADERLSVKCIETLGKLGYSVILMPPFPSLSAPVASHPDMLIFFLKGKMFVHKNYYDAHSDLIKKIGYLADAEILICEDRIGAKYPNDIIFNAFTFENYLVCNSNHTSECLLRYAKEENFNIIMTRQGYAKCSACVTDKFVISADKGLLRSLAAKGIEMLEISPEGVSLNGYDCGFIGGASGFDLKARRLFFCGDLNSHKSCSEISTICRKKGIEAISLSDERLYDYGTLMFI